MSELNWTKLWDEDEQRYRVQTRDGRKVRIFVTDAHDSMFPIVGEVERKGDDWPVEEWTADGRHYFSSNPNQPKRDLDLIPEPRKVRRWVNVYRTADPLNAPYVTGMSTFISYEAARKFRHGDYIATVPVEWEET